MNVCVGGYKNNDVLFTSHYVSHAWYGLDRAQTATQAVVILGSTSYIAIELNVLNLKSSEIQSNRCAQAILPLIAFLVIVCGPLARKMSQDRYISL